MLRMLLYTQRVGITFNGEGERIEKITDNDTNPAPRNRVSDTK